jgi:transcriptional regulator with XRE-family HTH domain
MLIYHYPSQEVNNRKVVVQPMHRLQAKRLEKRKTIQELARESRISATAIRSIENPTPDSYKTHRGVAWALADALGVDWQELFDDNELSHRGRPPFTGRPIGSKSDKKSRKTKPSEGAEVIDLPRTKKERVCPDCCIVVAPALNACGTCGNEQLELREHAA